jgi:hypothetical protein
VPVFFERHGIKLYAVSERDFTCSHCIKMISSNGWKGIDRKNPSEGGEKCYC